MENIDQKTLFVAFTPGQAADLAEGRSVFPQETSERFGLRTTKEEAIERAHYFHQWHSENVDTSQEEIPKKSFIIGTIRLSSLGYLEPSLKPKKQSIAGLVRSRWRNVCLTAVLCMKSSNWRRSSVEL